MPLTPATSPLYTYSLKTTEASHPRHPGSVILETPSPNPEDYRMLLVSRKYITTSKNFEGRTPINIVFLHGNGMNKGMWHYHIDQLYQKYSGSSTYYLNVVIALDAVHAGDSAFLNRKKLGNVIDWNDMARDILQIVKFQEKNVFEVPGAINLAVGHSMSGAALLMASICDPYFFTAVMLVNPVAYHTPEMRSLVQIAYHNWIVRNKIVTKFEIPKGIKWSEHILKYYKKVSFYKEFDDRVLENMIEDEIPDFYDINKDYQEVRMKHDGIGEYIAYFSAYSSVSHAMEMYKTIQTPIYHVWSDGDSVPTEGVEFIRNSIPNVTKIDLPDTGHSVNGTHPDLTIEKITEMIEDRIEIAEKTSPLNDFGYLKKYGKDYKSKLFELTFSEHIPDVKGPFYSKF